MAKRERLEVIRDILDVIRINRNSIAPTPLLRKSNLSTVRFNEYIFELVNKNFIREIVDSKNKKTYTLTDKGFMFLEKYQAMISFISDFGL